MLVKNGREIAVQEWHEQDGINFNPLVPLVVDIITRTDFYLG